MIDSQRSVPEAFIALAPSWAEINLRALRRNARALVERAGDATFMGVVKADGYGHGAVAVTRALQAEGIRWFGVATVPEAIQLRNAGIEDRILVFESPLSSYLPSYIEYDLDLTVGSREIAEALACRVSSSHQIRAHLKVDTGMTRLGILPREVPRVVRSLENMSGVRLESIWTHLASADEANSPFVPEQYERFMEVAASVSDSVGFVHIGNSGALLGWPRLFVQKNAGFRVGISLYGYPPSRELAGHLELHPVMTFKTRVLRVQPVAAGTTVSYNRQWKAAEDTRIVTLAAGYADGYPRLLSNVAFVYVGSQRLRVAGTVCMDMTMAEARSMGGDVISVGDEAILFGEGGPAAVDAAEWAQTIVYELCCGVGKRVPRSYIE